MFSAPTSNISAVLDTDVRKKCHFTILREALCTWKRVLSVLFARTEYFLSKCRLCVSKCRACISNGSLCTPICRSCIGKCISGISIRRAWTSVCRLYIHHLLVFVCSVLILVVD